MNLPENEATAWAIIHRVTPRLRYEHANAYQRRVHNRRKFLERLTKDDESGCWVWTGAMTRRSKRIERKYPVYYFVKSPGANTSAQVSHSFLLENWFSDAPRMMHTAPECENDRCINPYHRTRKFNHGRSINPEKVLQTYALKGTMSPKEASELTGVGVWSVKAIWNGWRWSHVTGQKVDKEMASH